MRTCLAVALACALAATGCSKKPTPAPATVVLPPVPAPADLIAEVVLARPAATWAALRKVAGGSVALLPTSPQLLAATLLDLPPLAAEQLDLTAPAFGAIAGHDATTRAALALGVKGGIRLADVLASDAGGWWRRDDAASGVTLVGPPGSSPGPGSLALGVVGGFLVVAASVEDLTALGPYAARTVATRAPSATDATLTLEGPALAGPVAAAMRGAWASFQAQGEARDRQQRAEHGGSAPDFGDPAAALADLGAKVDRAVALLGDLDRARLEVTLEAAGARARVEVDAKPGDGPASREIAQLTPGDARPLLDLPGACDLAWLTRDGSAARAEGSRRQAESLAQVFGGRLAERDRALVEAWLDTWAHARGDWLAGGLLDRDDANTLLFATAAGDEAAVARLFDDGPKLLALPAFAAPLAKFGGALTLVPGPQPADAHALHFTRRPPKVHGRTPHAAPPGAGALDVLWALDRGVLRVAGGARASDAWAALAAPAPGSTLAADAEVATATAHLGADVAFALVARPLRLVERFAGKRADAPALAAPLVLALGGHARSAWLELDLSPALSREGAGLARRVTP